MKYKSIIICGLCLGALGAKGLELNLTPGELAKSFAAVEGTHDTNLKLTGTANVTDLIMLRQLPKTITTVDMGALIVQSYEYRQGNYMGQCVFANGELPAFMLFGTNVKKVICPAATSIIGTAAFANTQLTEADIPATVTKIGDFAFSRMPELKKVSFNGSAELGKGVFRYSPKLSEVNISGTLPVVPDETFKGCTSLTTLPAGMTTIGNSAFRMTSLQSIDLNGVSEVGDFAFADDTQLNEVILDSTSVPSFGTGVFYGCSSLESLPEWITALTPVMLAHSGVSGNRTIDSEVVGEGVLANAANVSSVTLSKNVKSIKRDAFRNMNSLAIVDVAELGGNIPQTDEDAFSGLLNDEGRYDITLDVKDDNKQQWQDHDVWGLFNIRAIASKVDLPSGENILVKRNNNVVSIQAGTALDLVEIYNAGGLKLFEGGNGASNVEAELAEPGVLIVRILSGNKVYIRKI